MENPTESPEPIALPVAPPPPSCRRVRRYRGISRLVRLAVVVSIVAAILGVTASSFLASGRWTLSSDLGLPASLNVPIALGRTVGYHRQFLHRSIEANVAAKFARADLASMAG